MKTFTAPLVIPLYTKNGVDNKIAIFIVDFVGMEDEKSQLDKQ